MAHHASSSEDAITGINMTPLVDITLVLLIIFMVTAKLIAGQSVPLDLPKAATAGVTQTVLTVEIDERGHVSANGQAVADRAALEQKAKVALGDDPALRALISASARASHGTVLQVMDSLRKVGLSKIAFAADKAEPALTFGDATP
jgi:biopolymer transport protein ExbD